MMTKAPVALLKKYDLHDRTWQPVVNHDESQDRTGQPVVKRDTCHELKHGLVGRRSSSARQLGCVLLTRHEAAEAHLTEELRHAETNPT